MPCYRTLVVRDPAGRPHFPRGLSFCRLHFPRGLSFCRPNGFASTARGSVLLSPTVAPFQEVCPFVAPLPKRSVLLSPQRIRLHCQEVCPFVALLPLSRRSVLLSLPGGLSICRPNGFASTARRSVLLSPCCPFPGGLSFCRPPTTDSPPLPGGLSFCRLHNGFASTARRSVLLSPMAGTGRICWFPVRRRNRHRIRLCASTGSGQWAGACAVLEDENRSCGSCGGCRVPHLTAG